MCTWVSDWVSERVCVCMCHFWSTHEVYFANWININYGMNVRYLFVFYLCMIRACMPCASSILHYYLLSMRFGLPFALFRGYQWAKRWCYLNFQLSRNWLNFERYFELIESSFNFWKFTVFFMYDIICVWTGLLHAFYFGLNELENLTR